MAPPSKLSSGEPLLPSQFKALLGKGAPGNNSGGRLPSQSPPHEAQPGLKELQSRVDNAYSLYLQQGALHILAQKQAAIRAKVNACNLNKGLKTVEHAHLMAKMYSGILLAAFQKDKECNEAMDRIAEIYMALKEQFLRKEVAVSMDAIKQGLEARYNYLNIEYEDASVPVREDIKTEELVSLTKELKRRLLLLEQNNENGEGDRRSDITVLQFIGKFADAIKDVIEENTKNSSTIEDMKRTRDVLVQRSSHTLSNEAFQEKSNDTATSTSMNDTVCSPTTSRGN